jgi:hypothetical protein
MAMGNGLYLVISGEIKDLVHVIGEIAAATRATSIIK